MPLFFMPEPNISKQALLLCYTSVHLTGCAAGHLTSMCGLSATQKMDADSVHALLQRAIQLPSCGAMICLCGLPGAQGITQAHVHSLLVAAVAAGGHHELDALTSLPGAQCLAAEAVKQLLNAALHSEELLLTTLLELPAVRNLSAADVNYCSERQQKGWQCNQVSAAAQQGLSQGHACGVDRGAQGHLPMNNNSMHK